MKKIIFGIFAHPDDEAFGPAGTLLAETENGSELHLVTLTSGDGEFSANLDNHDNLGEVRLQEWQDAGSLLGAHRMTNLGYSDGKLNNDTMIEVSERLVDMVQACLKNEPDDTAVEFMALDLNGLTGHIDHIVATRAACLAFYQLKKADPRMSRIRLYCLSSEFYPTENTRWIYMEQGRAPEEIDERIDNRARRAVILEVMRAHHTQRSDAEFHIKLLGDSLGIDHFIVKK